MQRGFAGDALGWDSIILTGISTSEDILAIVGVEDGKARIPYVSKPFGKEPDFGIMSVNYDMSEMMAMSEAPAQFSYNGYRSSRG